MGRSVFGQNLVHVSNAKAGTRITVGNILSCYTVTNTSDAIIFIGALK